MNNEINRLYKICKNITQLRYNRINFQCVQKWFLRRSVKIDKASYSRDLLIMSAWDHKTLLSPPGSKTWWQHRFFLLDRFYKYDECSLIQNENNDTLATIGHWLCGGSRKFRQKTFLTIPATFGSAQGWWDGMSRGFLSEGINKLGHDYFYWRLI